MIADHREIILTPGNGGKNCFGNGTHLDKNGTILEYCCDECAYFLECFPTFME